MPRRLALIIGNSDYADAGFAPLASAAQDVALMGKVLQNLGGFAVTSLLNEPWYKLQAEVARFFANKMRDDVLLLYFSGHGKRDPDDSRLYFVAHNACQASSEPPRPSSAVSTPSGKPLTISCLSFIRSSKVRFPAPSAP